MKLYCLCDLARSCYATQRYVSQSENGTTRRASYLTSVQNKMADGNNILRPVSTFSNKFRLYTFDGARSAEACFAEPLKEVSAKSLNVLWQLKPGIHVIAFMVRWATNPTCERVEVQFYCGMFKIQN